MLTQTTEYALQALGHLAAEPARWHEVRQISAALEIPTNYLSKVLGQLTRLGVLESRKGWGGGFRIRGTPEDIGLEEIVRPLEGLGRPRACTFGLPVCSDEDPCPLHDYWKRIREIYDEMLRETTVADLVRDARLPFASNNSKKAGPKRRTNARGGSAARVNHKAKARRPRKKRGTQRRR